MQEIASGGFGSVYLTKIIGPDDRTGRISAVKLLHRRWTENVEISSRMRDEARLLTRLRHENIVEVLDFAVIDGRSAIVMEYLDAVDARTIVEHLRTSGSLLPLGAAFEIGAAVSSALDAAYNRPPTGATRPLRVIHRDIKPSNLMVDQGGRVKVLDFGIARAEFDAREAKTAELAFGSLEYMPPERLFFEPESAASDVYSLGTAIFELLCAEKLGKAKLRQSEQERFLNERLRELLDRNAPLISDPAVSTEIVDLLKAMLSFDEVQRPSAAEVTSRMRVLAGWCGSPDLEEWSQQNIPRILDLHRSLHQGSGTLVGQVLLEDMSEPLPNDPRWGMQGLGPSTGRVDNPASARVNPITGRVMNPSTGRVIPPAGLSGPSSATPGPSTGRVLGATPSPAARNPSTGRVPTGRGPGSGRGGPGRADPHTGRTDLMSSSSRADQEDSISAVVLGVSGYAASAEDRTVRDDTRWKELKQATLASLTDPAEGYRAGAGGSYENRPQSPLEWLGEEDELEGAPTVRMEQDERWREILPQAEELRQSEIETVVVPGESAMANELHALGPPIVVMPPPDDAAANATMAYAITALLLFATSVLILLSVLVVGGVGLAALTVPSGNPPAPAAPMPVLPPTPAAPTVPAGVTGATFRSEMAGTRRIMVRCDGATGVGTDRVVVPGETFTECTVTAVDATRKRRTAVVRDVSARSYDCFVGDDSSCK